MQNIPAYLNDLLYAFTSIHFKTLKVNKKQRKKVKKTLTWRYINIEKIPKMWYNIRHNVKLRKNIVLNIVNEVQ